MPEKCTFPHRTSRFGTTRHLKRHINDVHDSTESFFCYVKGCKYERGSREDLHFPREENLARHERNMHAISSSFLETKEADLRKQERDRG
jgi:hypothetical protein